jgi:hypothetical protein
MTKNNYSIESLAKKLVASYEESQGRSTVPKSKGEYGYDTKSQDSMNRIRFIEIKSTEKARLTSRWLEPKEYQAMQSLENYYVYAVTSVDLEKQTGRITEFSKLEWLKRFHKEEMYRWFKFNKTDFEKGIVLSV